MRIGLVIIIIMLSACLAYSRAIVVPGEYSTLGEALYASLPGDSVLVQAGIYYEHDVKLETGVSIISYGGVAVVDAQGQGRCMYSADPIEDVHIKGLEFRNGSALHGGALLIHGSWGVVLESCVIRDSESTEKGGGLAYYQSGYLPDFRQLILDNVVFENNHSEAGGGLYLKGPGIIRGCEFISNTASLKGGAVFVIGTVSFYRIIDTTIETSSAVYGGGIYIMNGYLSVENGHVRDNYASARGGGIYSESDGVLCIDSQVIGNTAGGNGGGIWCQSGQVAGDNSVFSNSVEMKPGIVSLGSCYFVCCKLLDEDVDCEDIVILDEDCPVASEEWTFGGLKRAYR